MSMKKILVTLGTIAVSMGITLAGAGTASANGGGGICGTGPWGQIIVCWQPNWGWNNWNNGWNNGWNGNGGWNNGWHGHGHGGWDD